MSEEGEKWPVNQARVGDKYQNSNSERFPTKQCPDKAVGLGS